MRKKRLASLLQGISLLERRGQANPWITHIAYDSRDVVEGSLFVALPGKKTDGHAYIDQAIEAGALSIVHEAPLMHYRDTVVYLRVAASRITFSSLSAAFHDHPSREITVIGVTGTDGKTTTVYFIHQLLTLWGEESGFISTVNYSTGKTIERNPFGFSTPAAFQVQALLREMVENGKKYAIIEASSHALSEKNSRLVDVAFTVGVFTNLSREHIDFHGSVEQYQQDKAHLFRSVAKHQGTSSFGVINRDDPSSEFFMDLLGESPVYKYSVKTDEADLYASEIRAETSSVRFLLETPSWSSEATLPVAGKFNVENTLAALMTVSEVTETPVKEFLPFLPKLLLPAGRMHHIPTGDRGILLFVDFAHTPGAFARVLSSARSMLSPHGRLITLFGAPGERDSGNRPKLGAIADEKSDIIILTDDDPRGEEPLSIIQEIGSGIRNKREGGTLFSMPNRQRAIQKALSLAHRGDCLLSLGKGHEKTIHYADHTRPWDEFKAWSKALEEQE